MREKIVVLVTASSVDEAKNIATTLVTEKLCACVNILPGVTSICSWDGKICDEREVLMIIKTGRNLFGDLEKRVSALHSYDVPEIIALPIKAGSQPYLDWIDQNTR